MNDLDVFISRIKWAEEYIKEFNRNEEFNPYDTLTHKQNSKQQLYEECVDFLAKLGRISDDFKDNRDKIVFSMSDSTKEAFASLINNKE